MKLINEVWRPIPDFEDYLVSNTGEVMNVHTRHILSPADNGSGYLYVNLYRGESPKRAYRFYVHRLVSKVFQDLQDDLEVNHRNGYKSMNFEHNLEPVTREENIQHAYDTGLIDMTNRSNVRPVRIVETGDVYPSADACARAIGGLGSSIRIALRFPNRTHMGYTYEYADGAIV